MHEDTIGKPAPATENVFSGVNDLKPIIVYYGSNMGTSMELANNLAKSAIQRGFQCTAAALDEATGSLRPGVLSVFISSSYDGQPTNNGAKFIDWISALSPNSLTGVEFVVFGCGNRTFFVLLFSIIRANLEGTGEWRDTFQRIPNLIFALLEKHGAISIAAKGSADAAEGDVLAQFVTWQASDFWPCVANLHGVAPGTTDEALRVAVVHHKPTFQPIQTGVSAIVKKVYRLTDDRVRPKYHLELELPEGHNYEVGGYLEILPRNPLELVKRALRALGLKEDDVLELHSSASTPLPTGVPLLAKDLLSHHLDLNQPATVKVCFCS